MYYPDLRSLDDVDDLPMPEFNLRIHCIVERVRWERGVSSVSNGNLGGAKANMPKTKLLQVLAELKQKQIAEENKANG